MPIPGIAFNNNIGAALQQLLDGMNLKQVVEYNTYFESEGDEEIWTIDIVIRYLPK